MSDELIYLLKTWKPVFGNIRHIQAMDELKKMERLVRSKNQTKAVKKKIDELDKQIVWLISPP